MSSLATKLKFVVPLATLALVLCAGPRAAAAALQPDKLVILSTTDVKGKTGPCGCHVPKGGFSRQAGFADSIRAEYSQVLLVDNGGYFPDQEPRPDIPEFMMTTMKTLGIQAAGVGERDLRYGIGFLTDRVKRTGLPVVCANLVDKQTQKPVFAPYVIQKAGAVKVGIFALISDETKLGSAGDSVAILEPAATARQTVAALRAKDVDVIVLLSQLGKIQSEDLVDAVDGIDAVMAGHDVPMLQKGRKIKNTIACYGGEQGQYVCQTVLTLDAHRHVTTGEADAVMMGPDVGQNPEMAKVVKTFEDAYKEKALKQQ